MNAEKEDWQSTEDEQSIIDLTNSECIVMSRSQVASQPDPKFSQYLSLLSSIGRQICVNVANEDSSHCLYCSPDPTVYRLSVGESWCIFPDNLITDQVCKFNLNLTLVFSINIFLNCVVSLTHYSFCIIVYQCVLV